MGKKKFPIAMVNAKAVPKVNRKQSVRKTKTRVFDKVPNEILEKILTYLPLEYKKSARLVSSRWKAVLNHPVRFSIPLTKLTLPDFEAVDYKLNELQVVLNKLKIPDKFSPRMKQSFQTAKTVHFKADDYAEWNTNVGGGIIDGKGIERILKSCQQIHTLKFDFSFMVFYRMTSSLDLKNIRFKFLTTLQVGFAFLSSGSVESAVLRLKMPCLRTLEVERFDLDMAGYMADTLYPVLLECLVRNRQTLRKLKLVRLLTTLSSTAVRIQKSDLFNELAQMNLESLEIHHWATTLWGAWGPANQLLNNLRSLKVLKLQTDCQVLMDSASNLILNNGNSLTTLELNVEHEADFDVDLLTALTALTDFRFTCDTPAFGFFPPRLETLTWNAPLSNDWYFPEIRGHFPNLISIALGPLALHDVVLDQLCDVLFGTGDQKTRLESITLQHKPVDENDLILSKALKLPTSVYQIECDENIRITLK